MPTIHVQAGSAAQLQEIADSLWKAKKVVVVTGAGISTNSGIPVSVFARPCEPFMCGPLTISAGFSLGKWLVLHDTKPI